MRFSANLRQPFYIPEAQKNADVEEIIELLELQPLADALVLSLGVEARKWLTIGVELASKPELLLFLDEPISGLDGQSACNILRFSRKLADHGHVMGFDGVSEEDPLGSTGRDSNCSRSFLRSTLVSRSPSLLGHWPH
jgi:ABC-type multidrug transport system ATPase subunit